MNYPGGKGACYHHIINLMPPHDVYIETHLGGGNVLERKLPSPSTIGIDVDATVIETWQGRAEYKKPGYTFINGDAGSILSEMTLTGRELIYSDPPYLHSTRKGGRLYEHEMTDEQHEAWLQTLKRSNCSVIISGYKSDLYMDTLSGWFYKEFQAATRRGLATESVWCNYRPTGRMHDYRFVGDNFRQREQIKRKRARWLKNFKALPPAERYSIYEVLSDHIATDSEATGFIAINNEGLRQTSSHTATINTRQIKR